MGRKLQILIVDDDPSMRKTLTDIFRVKGHQAQAAGDGFEALEKMKANRFDCVLTDIKMPGMDGVELSRLIGEAWPEAPVLLMTAYADDALTREELVEGVIAVLSKPLPLNALLDFFTYLGQERLVVIVDDDLNFCRTLADILQLHGFTVIIITDPRQVIAGISKGAQTVILDMKLDGTTGQVVLRQIRQQYPDLPVILVTGYRQEMVSAIEEAFAVSVHGCFFKPLQVDALLKALTEIYHQQLGAILTQ